MQDLDIRGAGNLLGAEQSGFIADMGFETYQKILNEAIAELRAEGVEGVDEVICSEQQEVSVVEDICYVGDCQIETDKVALLPDKYVSQPNEKIRLYRRLDSITEEAEMERFVAEMEDRFGKLPKEARALVDVVRLRWRGMALGFEKLKVKNGLMLGWFPADGKSPYYKSRLFGNILRHVSQNPTRFVLKQNNNRVYLTFRDVDGVGAACTLLDEFGRAVAATSEPKK
jgi:transcription-repair coupling factor (superfamily II helicase)